MNKNPYLLPSAAFAALLASPAAHAAISTYAEYHLGETGSVAGPYQIPQDSSGNNRNFSTSNSAVASLITDSAITAPGSTKYVDTRLAPNQAWYSSNLFTSLPTDNFAMGIYAAAPTQAGSTADVFTLGGLNNAFKISLGSNGWAASSHNASWIGTANGIAGSFKPNQWVHLALVRKAGVTTFYINGVAQGTYNGAPVHNSPHLSVSPGGITWFNGRLDEARVLTFAPTDSDVDILAALGATPLQVRKLVQDGELSYPAIALAAGETSEVRPGSSGIRDFTTIVDADAFTVAGQHTLKVLTSAGLETNIAYDLFRFNSAAPTLNLANFTLNLPPGVEASLAIDSEFTPDHYVTITFQDLGQRTWNGTLAVGGSIWDTTSLNWLDLASAPTDFANADTVTFSDAALSKNVSIAAGEVQPAFANFTATETYSITGPGKISGSGSMILSGGEVGLATASELSGAVTINAGAKLQINTGGSLGTAPIANAGTLAFNSTTPVSTTAAVSGGGTVEVMQGTAAFSSIFAASSVNIAAGAVFEMNAASALSHGVTGFSGAGTFRKTGASSVTWGPAATFALDAGALIDVQAGTFIGANSNNDVWTNNKAGLNVATGAAFESVEGTILVDAITGGGTIRAGYPGFANAAVVCGVADGSGTFSGNIIDYGITGAIGRLTKRGSGTQTLTGSNSYSGNTTVEGGTLVLDTAGSLTFKPAANGVSNRITGTGSVTLNGSFNLNLATANLTPGNSWNLVDVAGLTEGYGDGFTVVGFSQTNNVWTKTEGANLWTFTEADGNLTLSAAAGYSSWATTHASGQGPELDHDNDGVKNGIEYFMGQTGSGFTALPGPVTTGGVTTVTWTRNPAAPVSSFAVQFSATLNGDWATVPAGEVNLSDPTKVIYTYPAPLNGRRFVRLSVTP